MIFIEVTCFSVDTSVVKMVVQQLLCGVGPTRSEDHCRLGDSASAMSAMHGSESKLLQ